LRRLARALGRTETEDVVMIAAPSYVVESG
jgi:hypothetical protein